MRGEEFLMLRSPIFKRRYAHDSDIVIGCRLNCMFCYYKMIQPTCQYFNKNSKLKKLTTVDEYIQFLNKSRLVNDRDLVILGARGDASMYPRDIYDVTVTSWDKLEKDLKFLLLHRPPVTDLVRAIMKINDSVFFGTTVTPKAYDLEWTSIKEEKQIEKLINSDLDRDRVSIEIGPIIPETEDEAIEIIKRLNDNGFENVIVRGVSVGLWKIDEKEKISELKQCGFIDDQRYERGKEKKEYVDEHEFYRVKNYLEQSFYKKLYDNDCQWYRYSYEVYRNWGVPLACNRDNKIRISKRCKVPEARARKLIEEYGLKVKDIYRRKDHIYVELSSYRVTEDIAMTIGALLNEAVIFSDYVRSAECSDIQFYKKNQLFYI